MILRRNLRTTEVRHEASEEEIVLSTPSPRHIFLIVLFLVAAAIGFWLQHSQKQHFKEIAVRQQIWQIRNALVAYRAKFSDAPADLGTLAHAVFADPSTGKEIPLLDGVQLDKDGQMIDPLGYPYIYDRVRGAVFSTAPCCRDW
jgi:hypothetical protein